MTRWSVVVQDSQVLGGANSLEGGVRPQDK